MPNSAPSSLLLFGDSTLSRQPDVSPPDHFFLNINKKPRNESQIQINCPKGSLMHSGKQPPTSMGLLFCFILSRRDAERLQPSVTWSGRFQADWSHDTQPAALHPAQPRRRYSANATMLASYANTREVILAVEEEPNTRKVKQNHRDTNPSCPALRGVPVRSLKQVTDS